MEEKLFNCPVEAALSVVGGKYKSIILHHLMTEGTLRPIIMAMCEWGRTYK